MLFSVFGHFFSSYNGTGSVSFLNLTLLGLPGQQLLFPSADVAQTK